MFDPQQARRLAAALQTDEGYIEKDWHVVRALGVIAGVDVDGVAPAFSGGTSLAAAWRLINRFSEDIDFKVAVEAPNPSAMRKRRSAYREKILENLTSEGFVLDGDPLVGNESRFFRASFHYGATFPLAAGIRPALRIEMTFGSASLAPVMRPIQSLLGRALKEAPEIAALACVDPVETAADKLSALAWRAAARDRSAPDDDASIVRHLHDLAALAPRALASAEFAPLAVEILARDARRTKKADVDGPALLRALTPTLAGDLLWRSEYEQFVRAVSFGPDAERIGFDQALMMCETLIEAVLAK